MLLIAVLVMHTRAHGGCVPLHSTRLLPGHFTVLTANPHGNNWAHLMADEGFRASPLNLSAIAVQHREEQLTEWLSTFQMEQTECPERLPDGAVVRHPQGDIFVVVSNEKLYIDSCDQCGRSWCSPDIWVVNSTCITHAYPLGGALDCGTHSSALGEVAVEAPAATTVMRRCKSTGGFLGWECQSQCWGDPFDRFFSCSAVERHLDDPACTCAKEATDMHEHLMWPVFTMPLPQVYLPEDHSILHADSELIRLWGLR